MRAQVRAALEASPDLAGVKVYRSWAQSLGKANVPAIGVATPRETVRGATGSSVDRDTALIVQYVQTGDDELDDHLDVVSAVIESVVLGVLSGFELFEITSTDIDISGEGETLTGRLTLTFSATRYTPEGQAAAL
jgi:hypothetical protein